MENKKEVAIVFGFTHNFTFAVSCVMMDIKKFSPKWVDEVVIIHDGISDKEKKLLNNILPCRFIYYEFPINNKSKFDRNTLNFFSKMVFSKYECLKLLDEYKNVVWLDYDLVITQDISELTSYCNSGIKMLLSDHSVLGQLHSSVEDYDMTINGISAGTFIFQDHFPEYIKKYKFCYEKTEKYAKYLKYPEQAIFDFMIQDFKLNIDIINKDIYCVHPRDLSKFPNAKIVHSGGEAKFWNEIYNEQWNNNYKEWLRIGGSCYNYKGYLIKKIMKSILRKFGLYKNIKDFIIKLKYYLR
jgi:lipopolysaccharide biosynthesis glycosyltransferase